MGWKENQGKYISSYMKEQYIRVTIPLRKDNKNEMDTALLAAIKDAPSRSQALKELAYKGLKK